MELEQFKQLMIILNKKTSTFTQKETMKYIFLSLMLSKPSVDKCSAARPTSILLRPQREGQEKHFIRTSIFLTTSGQKLGETSTGKKKRV